MSALVQKRTFGSAIGMSAKGQKRLMHRSKMNSIAFLRATAMSGDLIANYVLTSRAWRSAGLNRNTSPDKLLRIMCTCVRRTRTQAARYPAC